MTHRGPLTDAHDRLAAELADDYLIEEEPGRGASATVYLAHPALELLEPLLRVPSWISPAELRSDPAWASLRAHPLYVQLVH